MNTASSASPTLPAATSQAGQSRCRFKLAVKFTRGMTNSLFDDQQKIGSMRPYHYIAPEPNCHRELQFAAAVIAERPLLHQYEWRLRHVRSLSENAMQRLPKTPLCFEFSRHKEPKLRIQPGGTIEVESEDAFCGQIRTDDDRRVLTFEPNSNPVNGPIYVEGAEPHDTLAVTIHEIRPASGQAATRTAAPKQLCQWLGDNPPHGVHVCPIADGVIHWSDQLTIPCTPVRGCIATAPHWCVPTTGPAGSYGGNLDIREVCPGNTVYLPVFVTGGYLYLGDAHAAQGHGELSATGLEMPAESVITVDLIKGQSIPGIRIESPDEIMAVATGKPLERPVANAYAWLILWMEAEYGWDRWQAYDLLTHVGEISTGYYDIGTAAAKINKRYLSAR